MAVRDFLEAEIASDEEAQTSRVPQKICQPSKEEVIKYCSMARNLHSVGESLTLLWTFDLRRPSTDSLIAHSSLGQTSWLAHCLDETFVEQILSLQSSLDTMLGDRLEAVSASGEASCLDPFEYATESNQRLDEEMGMITSTAKTATLSDMSIFPLSEWLRSMPCDCTSTR